MSQEQVLELTNLEAQIAAGKAMKEVIDECNEYVDSGQLDRDADEIERQETSLWERFLIKIGLV